MIGRLIIKLEGAINELDFQSQDERNEFLSSLADTLYERLRQNLLIWRTNKQAEDEKRAKENEKKSNEPPPTVPDHIRRERERAVAKKKVA
jgi:hypothetical protein